MDDFLIQLLYEEIIQKYGLVSIFFWAIIHPLGVEAH